jgi:hypothetical protein
LAWQDRNMPLLSFEEYNLLGHHTTPYIVKIKSADKHLCYFGEQHSTDLKKEQWNILRDSWNEWTEVTENEQRIVFTEGGLRIPAETQEKAISQSGGIGLITYLAFQEKIEIHSPEPNEKEERNMLEKEFSRDEIQYYYFARVVAQWWRFQDPKPEFEEYIAAYLLDDKKESGWQSYDFSLTSMKQVHRSLFNDTFDLENQKFFYDISKPTVLDTRVNQVARKVSNFRDEHIAKEIKKYWDEGKSIFGIYGATHVVRQEPLLRELLGNVDSQAKAFRDTPVEA